MTHLARAELLWDDLQKNELGGFSGINRPFWIVQAFKEVEKNERDRILSALDEPNTELIDAIISGWENPAYGTRPRSALRALVEYLRRTM